MFSWFRFSLFCRICDVFSWQSLCSIVAVVFNVFCNVLVRTPFGLTRTDTHTANKGLIPLMKTPENHLPFNNPIQWFVPKKNIHRLWTICPRVVCSSRVYSHLPYIPDTTKSAWHSWHRYDCLSMVRNATSHCSEEWCSLDR